MQVAVIASVGLGDALLMSIVCRQLAPYGSSCLFQPLFAQLQDWFDFPLAVAPLLGLNDRAALLANLSAYDLIVALNDNSALTRFLKKHRALLPPLTIFYPSREPCKHGALHPLDQICAPSMPLAEGIARAIALLLGHAVVSKQNGLRSPFGSVSKEPQRILLAPVSRQIANQWRASAFTALAKKLQKAGWDPLFVIPPDQQAAWSVLGREGLAMARTDSLSELAYLVETSTVVIGVDSFVGHLASNLGVPTIIIANNAERMKLWRPGWTQGVVITPQWFSWPYGISLKSILSSLENIMMEVGLGPKLATNNRC